MSRNKKKSEKVMDWVVVVWSRHRDVWNGSSACKRGVASESAQKGFLVRVDSVEFRHDSVESNGNQFCASSMPKRRAELGALGVCRKDTGALTFENFLFHITHHSLPARV